MWKALIKLVEKWACRHEWEHWQEVNVTSDLGRYQIHHFVCKKCGMIYDFEEEEQNFRSIKDQGFVIEKHRTVLYGECADCKQKKIKKFKSV